MKKLLVAAIVVLMASPAFAAIQNVKVSGDITTTFIDRNTFNLGETVGTEDYADGTTPGANAFQPVGLKKQNVFITQTRLRVDADLSDNVSTTVGIINERAWNAENTPGNGGSSPAYETGNQNTSNLDTNVQLYLASITLREFLYSPLTLTIGRQVFNYGNGLIMGDGGVNNQSTGNLQYIAQDFTERTAYDGVKAVLDYKPLTIDMFYFKNGQQILGGNANSDTSSSNVYGLNANYQLSDPMSTVVEGYLFTRFDGNSSPGEITAGGATQYNKGNSLYVPGLHVSTNPVKGLNVQGEVAWQLGNKVVQPGTIVTQESERRSAMAAQFLATYSLPVLDKYKPTVNASYTYVSGDKNGGTSYGPGTGSDSVKSSKTYSAWDPFNEAQGSGTIYNTLFPLTNMNIYSIGGTINPLEDVTVAATWSDLYAVKSFSSENQLELYQPDGGATTYAPVTKHNETGLGNEVDVNFTYNYTEDVTFGVSLGWFMPGDAFSSVNNSVASQAIADVGVKF